MGSRAWKIALAATAVALAGCAPLPTPAPALVVNTTADTFDGVCDPEDCSLRDAIHVANGRINANNLPNEVRVPAGTYELAADEPIAVSRPIAINGAGKSQTTLDLTGSTISSPGGVLSVSATTLVTGMRIVSDAATPTHILATCAGHFPRSVSVINSATVGLAAVSTACDAVFVGTEVAGPAAVVAPHNVSGTSSRLPFPDEPIVLRQFSFLNTVITGPSSADGTSADSTLTIHAPAGLNINGTFTGTHFERVGLTVGRPDAPAETDRVSIGAQASSFDLAGDAGPLRIRVQPRSSLRLTQSTVFGGGAAGAIDTDGTLILQGATIANAGPAIVVGDTATVTSRRSVLSAFDGPVCTAPITLTAYNAIVGSSCGTPSTTGLVVADHDDLELGPVDNTGSRTPTFSMMPAATSPLIGLIPRENAFGLDCPFNTTENSGTSIDQRGFIRPVGPACEAGAVEYQTPPPPPVTTTTIEAPLP